jgi:hypothetical protein
MVSLSYGPSVEKKTPNSHTEEKGDVLKDDRSMVFLEGKEGGVREHGSRST